MKTNQEKLERIRTINRALEKIEIDGLCDKADALAKKGYKAELDKLLGEVGYLLEASGRIQSLAGKIAGDSELGRDIQDVLFSFASDLERGLVDIDQVIKTLEDWIGDDDELAAYAKDLTGPGDKEFATAVYECAKNVITGISKAR